MVRWRDVFVILRHQPPASPLAVAMDAKWGPWTLGDQLAAIQINQMQSLMWGLGGGKGPRPKPVGPVETEPESEKYQGDSMTIDEAEAWAAKWRSPKEVNE